MPWDDASAGITNVSGLNDKPAGGRGFVVAKEGHFFEGDKRFRIFGVNFAFGASFPTHADAGKVADRMAKFGINCVRFHHMDNKAALAGIWSADMKTLDPGQLDKLDYFIAQLKRDGIYADLNLHVSRNYPGMPKWEGMETYYKGVDNFYPPMLSMQQDYARQLLTHVNPYTHTAYVDEPAVALIEINNENGLIGDWWRGSLDGMSEEYRADLQARWNRWLQTKYASQAALEKAWSVGEEPLGAEMLKETDFEHGVSGAWVLEQHDTAVAGPSGKDDIRLDVSHTDAVGWHVQLFQPGIAFLKGKHYTVTFAAKSDPARRIVVVASQSHAPWNQLWSADAGLTYSEYPGIGKYQFTFQPSADEPNGRFGFSDLGTTDGTSWIENPSLRPGGILGLQSGERLGAVPIFRKSEIGNRTDAAQRDWMVFLYDTETQYWTGMEQYLKKDLKAHSLIVGTATGYSPPSIQARMDVVDGHAYWHHPHFGHGAWDSVDWIIPNLSMAGDPAGGTLPGLAEHRVAGKPYICSEYNAPAPNTHSSEAFLLLGAYAALQDWDGVFIFAYSHRTNDWDRQRMMGFFDVDQHPTKLVTLPAAVSMFLRGDISRAVKTVTYSVSPDATLDASVRSGARWGMEAFGMGTMLPLRSAVQLDFGSRAARVPTAKPAAENVTVSDTGQLTWDVNNSRVLVNSPRSKAFIGKTTGGAVQLGDVIIDPGGNRQNWAAITITDMTPPVGAGMGRHLLITATGYIENPGMRWKSPAEDSVGSDWGTPPSLAEGIPASITLPGGFSGVKAWALDARGQRKIPVEVTRTERGSVLEIGPQYQTLWYEVDIPSIR